MQKPIPNTGTEGSNAEAIDIDTKEQIKRPIPEQAAYQDWSVDKLGIDLRSAFDQAAQLLMRTDFSSVGHERRGKKPYQVSKELTPWLVDPALKGDAKGNLNVSKAAQKAADLAISEVGRVFSVCVDCDDKAGDKIIGEFIRVGFGRLEWGETVYGSDLHSSHTERIPVYSSPEEAEQIWIEVMGLPDHYITPLRKTPLVRRFSVIMYRTKATNTGTYWTFASDNEFGWLHQDFPQFWPEILDCIKPTTDSEVIAGTMLARLALGARQRWWENGFYPLPDEAFLANIPDSRWFALFPQKRELPMEKLLALYSVFYDAPAGEERVVFRDGFALTMEQSQERERLLGSDTYVGILRPETLRKYGLSAIRARYYEILSTLEDSKEDD
ncbi:MAG: hypothetical protein KDB07_06030 [Planctomycetes bacterium]|nr:hypothetical protein [Planctomycetota bacterium]